MDLPLNNPLVSVVISVKNGELFLHEALKSVLQQKYEPIEILVIDGHSTDKTAEIALSYEGVQHIMQPGRGIADGNNTGVNLAKGDLIAFLSHDDKWTSNKLSTQIRFMQENPKFAFTNARIKFFLEPGCKTPSGFRTDLLQGDHIGVIMETLVARKSVFDRVGPFDTSLKISEDIEWFARAKDYNIKSAVIQEVLLYKRVHDKNISIHTDHEYVDLFQAIRKSIHRKEKN
jgi:glycosyltransferase involved in cell wall biosynthesis